jgi:hypothetical protein
MSGYLWSTQGHNLEDCTLHSHCFENLKTNFSSLSICSMMGVSALPLWTLLTVA